MPSYEHPRPALTADVVVFAGDVPSREVLLVRRGTEPFLGMWAIPGGFVDEGERIEDAARRELVEETGVELDRPLKHVGTFGDPGRDPRGWTVSAAYMVDAGAAPPAARAGDDAADAAWFAVGGLPELAFDHARIVAAALEVAEQSSRR